MAKESLTKSSPQNSRTPRVVLKNKALLKKKAVKKSLITAKLAIKKKSAIEEKKVTKKKIVVNGTTKNVKNKLQNKQSTLLKDEHTKQSAKKSLKKVANDNKKKTKKISRPPKSKDGSLPDKTKQRKRKMNHDDLPKEMKKRKVEKIKKTEKEKKPEGKKPITTSKVPVQQKSNKSESITLKKEIKECKLKVETSNQPENRPNVSSQNPILKKPVSRKRKEMKDSHSEASTSKVISEKSTTTVRKRKTQKPLQLNELNHVVNVIEDVIANPAMVKCIAPQETCNQPENRPTVSSQNPVLKKPVSRKRKDSHTEASTSTVINEKATTTETCNQPENRPTVSSQNPVLKKPVSRKRKDSHSEASTSTVINEKATTTVKKRKAEQSTQLSKRKCTKNNTEDVTNTENVTITYPTMEKCNLLQEASKEDERRANVRTEKPTLKDPAKRKVQGKRSQNNSVASTAKPRKKTPSVLAVKKLETQSIPKVIKRRRNTSGKEEITISNPAMEKHNLSQGLDTLGTISISDESSKPDTIGVDKAEEDTDSLCESEGSLETGPIECNEENQSCGPNGQDNIEDFEYSLLNKVPYDLDMLGYSDDSSSSSESSEYKTGEGQHLPDNQEPLPNLQINSNPRLSDEKNNLETPLSIEVVLEEEHNLSENQKPFPNLQMDRNSRLSAETYILDTPISIEDCTKEDQSCASYGKDKNENFEQNKREKGNSQASFFVNFGLLPITQTNSNSESLRELDSSDTLTKQSKCDSQISSCDNLEFRPFPQADNSPKPLPELNNFDSLTEQSEVTDLEDVECTKSSNKSPGTYKNCRNNLPSILADDLKLSSSSSPSSSDTQSSDSSNFGRFKSYKNHLNNNVSKIHCKKRRINDESKSPKNNVLDGIKNVAYTAVSNCDEPLQNTTVTLSTPNKQRKISPEPKDHQDSGIQIKSLSKSPMKSNSPTSPEEILKRKCSVVLDRIDYGNLFSKEVQKNLDKHKSSTKQKEKNSHKCSKSFKKYQDKIFKGKFNNMELKVELNRIDVTNSISPVPSPQTLNMKLLPIKNNLSMNSTSSNIYNDISSGSTSTLKSKDDIISKQQITKGNYSAFEGMTEAKLETDETKYCLIDSKKPVVQLQRLNTPATIVYSPKKQINNISSCNSKKIGKHTIEQSDTHTVKPKKFEDQDQSSTKKNKQQNHFAIQIVAPPKKKLIASKPPIIQKMMERKLNSKIAANQNTQTNDLKRSNRLTDSKEKIIRVENNKIVITRKIVSQINSSNPSNNNPANSKSQLKPQTAHINNSVSNLVPETSVKSNFVKKTVNLSNPSSSTETNKTSRNMRTSNNDNFIMPLVKKKDHLIHSQNSSRSTFERNNQSTAYLGPSCSGIKSQSKAEVNPRSVHSWLSTHIDWSKKGNQNQDVQESIEENDAFDTTSVLSLFVTPELKKEVDHFYPAGTNTSNTDPYYQRKERHADFDLLHEDSYESDNNYDEQYNYEGKTSYERSKINYLPSKPANGLNESRSGHQNTQTAAASNWINPNPELSLNAVCDDQIPEITVLSGSPFDGYCIDYLRTSIPASNHHNCKTEHKVPLVLHQVDRYGQGDHIATAIENVISKGFNNPPVEVIEHFVSFCVINNKRTLLERIGKALKENISTRFDENKGIAKEIWRRYINSYLKEARKNMHGIDCRHQTLNEILKSVFTSDGTLQIEYEKVLHIILEVLAEATYTNKNLQILSCVEFLRDSTALVNSPICFKLAITKQVVQASHKRPSVDKFAYKVYKSFYEDTDTWRDIYEKDPESFKAFYKILGESYGIPIPFEATTTNKPSSLINSDSGSCNEESQLSSSEVSIWKNDNVQNGFTINSLESRIIKYKANPSVVSKFLSTANLNEVNLKVICQSYRNLKDGHNYYLEMIQRCSDDVKESLNDITLSFMMIEAKKMSWSSAYKFFKELKNHSSANISDDLNGRARVSPAKVTLICITTCLKGCDLKEAISLFIKYGFHSTESASWPLAHIPDDIKHWTTLCTDFSNALQSPSFAAQLLHSALTNLMIAQKSLLKPVELSGAFKKLASRLLNENEHLMAAEMVNSAFDLNLMKQFSLEQPYHYRLILIKLIDYGIEENIHLFLYKAQQRVQDYFLTDVIKEEIHMHEIHMQTNMTEQEMYAIILSRHMLLKAKQLRGNLTVIFKETKGLPVNEFPELAVDCSVPKAIQRCKIALKKFLPRASCISKAPNTILVDRIILEN